MFGWYNYKEWVDLMVDVVFLLALTFAFLLAYREWRRSNNIADRHAAATEHLARALDATATAITSGSDRKADPQ